LRIVILIIKSINDERVWGYLLSFTLKKKTEGNIIIYYVSTMLST